MSSEWTQVSLKEITSTLGDGLHGTPQYDKDGDYFFINGNNLGSGKIVFTEATKRVSFNEYNKHKKNLTERTILVSINGTLGNVAFYNGEKVVLGKSACYFNVIEDVDKHFVRYVMESEIFQGYIENLATGSTIKNVSLKLMRDFQFSLPPLVLQEKISGIFACLDDRIAILRETNTTLEAIAQALFKSWFVDFDPVHAKQQGREPEGMNAATAALFPDRFDESELGLVPREWHVGMVADIGEVICGKTPPTSEPANYGHDVPFITIPDMHNLLAVTSTNRSLSTMGSNTQKKKTLPPGSICVSCIATAGLVIRVTTPSQTNQQINSVVPQTKWGKSFPLFTLRRIGEAVRAGGSGGSVFHNLNKSGFEKLKVLFPSEQLALSFDHIVEAIIEKIIANQKQAQTLVDLRDTLLPRLISGQLRLPETEVMVDEVPVRAQLHLQTNLLLAKNG